MKTSEKIDLLSKALVLAQKEISCAVKESKNPFFKSSYASFTAVVNAVKEPLNRNGIAFMQLVNSNGHDFVETILLHESGQFISTETAVHCAKPNDPQAFGSGITYTKRYALQAVLGLPTEDDDGNAASAKKQDDKQDLTKKQLDFIESVKAKVNEGLNGETIDGQLLVSYLTEMAKRTGKKISEDLKSAEPMAKYILAKPDTIYYLKGN